MRTMVYQMKIPGRYVFAILIILAVTSFTHKGIGGTPTTHKADTSIDSTYFGNYSITENHQLGIDKFITDDGTAAMLFSDYSSGVVRRLFPIGQNRFVMGPGFNTATPAELTITFVTDKLGLVKGISLHDAGGKDQFARRTPLQEKHMTFQNGDAKLDGTLLIPSTKGPHPAIVLLHGSGPLTRYSFGPYPHFFTSL